MPLATRLTPWGSCLNSINCNDSLYYLTSNRITHSIIKNKEIYYVKMQVIKNSFYLNTLV